VSVKVDANENIRPVKPKPGSPHRIDGIVSLIMAIGSFSASLKPKPEEPEPGMLIL
jgi:phage terminase large subunit-like protein